jgi:hypothetical protein
LIFTDKLLRTIKLTAFLGTVGVWFLERNILREEFHPMMKALLISTGFFVLFAGVVGGMFLKTGKNPDMAASVCRPPLTSDLGRNVRIRTASVDSPLVCFESAEVVKRKLGPFSMAAFNILRINQLSITVAAPGAEDPALNLCGFEDSIRNSLSLDTGMEGRSSRFGIKERVSGIEIAGFELAVKSGNGVICILQADRAEGCKDKTFALKNCFFMDENRQPHRAPRAVLNLKEPLTLTSDGHQIVLRDVVVACAGLNPGVEQ